MDDEIETRSDRLELRAGELAGAIPGEAASVPHEVPSAPTDAESSTTSTPGQRLSRRAKVRRALVAGGVVVLAVVVLGALVPDAGASLRAALGIPTPVPTAKLPIGAGTFLIEDTVPWGTLLVDGHEMSLEPLPPEPNEPAGAAPHVPSFVLGRGRHTIEYRAAPFLTLRCVVSVPAARSDTCPLAHPSTVDPVHAFGAARVLDLQARPERLPPEQEQALERVLLTALNANIPTARVAVGERYLGADGAVHVATQPLVASLTYTVNRDPTRPIPAETGPCVALCREYPGGYPIPDGSWRFAAHMVVAWRYTRLNGSVELDSVPAAEPPGDAQLLMDVDVRWANGWTMADVPSPGVCDIANNMLTDLLDAMPPDHALVGYEWSQFADYPASGGCLLAAAQTVDADNQPIGPTAFVLYRFGVLLAANDLAHQLFPSLPLADAQERALARSLAPQSAQG